jgi:hypothetical protein
MSLARLNPLRLSVVVTLCALVAVCMSVIVCSHLTYASTVTLYPDGDPAASIWNPSAGATRYGILDNPAPVNGQQICRASGAGVTNEYYSMQTANVGQGATSMVVNTNAADDYLLFGNSAPDVVLGAQVDGALIGAGQRWKPPQNTNFLAIGCGNATGWPYASYTTPTILPVSGAFWDQSQIDGMKLLLGVFLPGSDRSMSVRQLNALVTYDAIPVLSMNGAKVYNNANSTTPGSQLADYNTTANLAAKGAAFRLRMNATNTGPDRWRAGFGTLKLQYAQKTVADCVSQTGWQDVQTGSGNIRWNDNVGVAENAAISILGGDSKSADLTAQTYRESNNFTIANQVNSGKSAQWDFSLREAAPVSGATYCFKIVPVSGITSVTYAGNNFGAVVKTFGALEVDIVDGAGIGVPSPVVSFSNLIASLGCQTSTAVMGSASQKIRLANGSATAGWSLSVAPTGGASDLWSSGGGDQYDFNDGTGSGCSDGGDADTKSGQLQVSPASSTVTAMSGCTNTGISNGSNASFSQGSIDSITVLTASASAEMYCYWDQTGIGLTQKVPPSAPTGTYTLDLTLTAVAS